MLKISSLVSFLKYSGKFSKDARKTVIDYASLPIGDGQRENTVEALPLTPVYSGILGCLDCFKCD